MLFVDQLFVEIAGADPDPGGSDPDPGGSDPGGSDPGNGDSLLVIGDRSRQGTQSGGFSNTFASDNSYQRLSESNGRLVHEWTFRADTAVNATLHIEARIESSTDVFWVSYSNDGRSYQNLLELRPGSETISTRLIPQTLTGEVYVKIQDSNQFDAFSDSVFVDELKLVIE